MGLAGGPVGGPVATVDPRPCGLDDLGGHPPESRSVMVSMDSHSKVNLSDGANAVQFCCVNEQREVDAVAICERKSLEQHASCGVFPRERLDDTSKFRPMEVEQRSRNQLGDAPTTSWHRLTVAHEGPFVDSFNQLDLWICHQWTKEADDVRR